MLYERWWFWTGALALVGGAIATSLLLSQDTQSSPPPGDVGGVVEVLGVRR
jgi:hypothetical protein